MKRAIAVFGMMLAACQSLLEFQSDTPEASTAGSDASGPGDAPLAEAGTEGAAVAAGTMTVKTELDRAVAIAADSSTIYWWSSREREIHTFGKVSKVVGILLPRPDQEVSRMVADGTGVYWIESGLGADGSAGSAGSRVRRLAFANGSEVDVIDPGGPALYRLAVQSGDVIAMGDSNVYLASKNGTGGLRIFSHGFDTTSLSAHDAYVYSTTGRNSIWRMEIASGNRSKIMSGLDAPREVQTDEDRIFWLGKDAIFSCALGEDNALPSAATTLLSGESDPTMLAAYKDALHWANGDGTIRKVSKLGGDASTVIDDAGQVTSFAVDGDGIYWTTAAGAVMWHRP